MAETRVSTPAMLAVFLITQGCLPLVFETGTKPGGVPVPGRTLSEEERQALGLTKPGVTICYETDGVDVFLDMAGDEATVWFAEGDFTSAAVLLEQMLARMFQSGELQLAPAEQVAGSRTMTRRVIVQPAGSRRVALLSVTFGPPDAQGADRMFFTRIYPQERRLQG